ncbi:DUF1804 family protein [Alteromonas sp. KUL49]|uniref:DUF1804 family protein n=1 Tax=Alteromonas sp. KUL49 TaxID=2480798 RepID=UPI00102EE550|nr:DUF1804 family protein [Alteromonas sp. KUL49]TAP38765.1 DUF1804 family protein [Alteromonas sp. KUL49]GEA12721.1 hypothetical protein KUL49_30960 [Alteromonas sp. KUL49]
MAHSSQKQLDVRSSYVNEQLDLKAAAAFHGVSYGTARNWKKRALDEGDNWDTARTALLLTNSGNKEFINQVIQRFYIQSERIFESIENTTNLDPNQMVELMAKWADSVSKISKHLGTNNDFNRIGFALELLQLLSTFIREQYPQHAQAFLEILEPFGREVTKTYG